MPLGFVIIGMALGLVSAVLTLVEGAGFGLAFLAYAGSGAVGTGLAVLTALISAEKAQDNHTVQGT